MSSVSRAKATIEELKKLFSKGRKPTENDFAMLIDTLNDEIPENLYYTQEEVNKLIECAKNENMEEVVLLLETIEDELDQKANLEHEHIAYMDVNHCLRDQDVEELICVFKGIKTVEEVIESSKLEMERGR